MYKEVFQTVMQKDEEIKWCNKSNAVTSMLKGIFPVIAIGAFLSFFISGFISPYTIMKNIGSSIKVPGIFDIFNTPYKKSPTSNALKH